MIRIARLKGLFFCLIVLLATAVGSVQMPRVQASNSSIALKKCGSNMAQYKACKWDPIAAVYYRCKANTAQGTCKRINKYYYVHNGIALANVPNHVATNPGFVNMGHVGPKDWPKVGIPQGRKWYICSKQMVLKAIKDGNKERCHRQSPTGSYWVYVKTKSLYSSSVTPFNGSQKIHVDKVAIAYKIGKDVNNAVFVCYLPNMAKICKTKSKTFTMFKFKGKLYYEHYVNKMTEQGERGDKALKASSFKLDPNAHKPTDTNTATIQVVRLRSLTYPTTPSI